MQDIMNTLKRVNESTGVIEEEHNETLDTHADMQMRIRELDEDLREELIRIQNNISSLREDIRERIRKAKRATVILSLIAQSEEVKPLQTRIDKQPYEHYATTDWFVSALRKHSKSR